MTCFTNSLFKVYNNLSLRETGPEVYNTNQNEDLPPNQQKQIPVSGMDLYVDNVLHMEAVEAPLKTSILRKPKEKKQLLGDIQFKTTADI